MKVVFLDVDGVLNSVEKGFNEINGELVQIFLPILERTGAYVVFSSSWRQMPNWIEVLCLAGIPVGRIHDRTPDSHFAASRGTEVKEWLDAHPRVVKYAILDDNSDFLFGQPLFQTDPRIGITEQIAEQVIEWLNKEDEPPSGTLAPNAGGPANLVFTEDEKVGGKTCSIETGECIACQ